MTGITQGTTGVSFTYDAAGRRTSLTLPDGIVVNYGYDAASELTGLTYAEAGNVLGNLTYAGACPERSRRDGDGRRIQMHAAGEFDNSPVKAASDVGLSGFRHGVIPGGGPLDKGIAGETTDAVVNAFGRSVTGAGSETLQLGLNSSVNTAETILAQRAEEAGVTAIDLSGAEAATTLDWATPVGWVKLVWDAGTLGAGLIHCW